MNFYYTSLLTQQSSGRHVAPLKYIILIQSQPVFTCPLQCYVLFGETTNTNFIVFALTRPELELTVYRIIILYPELSFPLRSIHFCQRSFYKIFVKFRNSKKMYLKLF